MFRALLIHSIVISLRPKLAQILLPSDLVIFYVSLKYHVYIVQYYTLLFNPPAIVVEIETFIMSLSCVGTFWMKIQQIILILFQQQEYGLYWIDRSNI